MFCNPKNPTKTLSVFILAGFVLACLTPAVHAEEATQSDDQTKGNEDWYFVIGVYGWLQDIHGDLKSLDGTENDFTIPLSEIIEDVESVLEAMAEIGYKNWFLAFDGTWVALGGSYQGRVMDLDVEIDQDIFDIHLGYGVFRNIRVVDENLGKKPWARISSVDVLLGARYFGTTTKITETTHLTGNINNTSSDITRWDPFFGARGAYSLSNRWLINLSAEIGGFGIGDAADFTYQVDANIGFRISHPISAFVGYRVLGYDLGDDSGGATDITQYGPKIGGTVEF